jgi:hypothetical protein
MTRSVKLNLIQTLRCKIKRGVAVIRKISSAHITMGLVAAALFATVYALETKAFPASEPPEKPFGVFLQPQSE